MAEWSTISLADLGSRLRLDSEYYEPRLLEAEQKLQSLGLFGAKVKPIENLFAHITNGHTPRHHDLSSGEVIFLTAEHVYDFRIDFSSRKRVELEHHEGELGRTRLEINDILVTIKGKVGNVALVSHVPGAVNINQDVALLRTPHGVDPYYVVGYLNSGLGKSFSERVSTGQINPFLSLGNLKTIPVPVFADSRHERIGQYVRQVLQKYERELASSRAMLAEAEQLLLHSMGVDMLDLSPQTTYTTLFSDIVTTRRFDAECFQPKHAILSNRIRETGQAILLKERVREPIRRGVLPEYIEGGDIPVINSQHVGKTHIELDNNRYTSRDFAAQEKNQRGLVGQYDVLLNSTGYITIGRCQVLLDDIRALADGHISIIRPTPDLDPVYLSFYLNSMAGQLQTEQGWTGSSGQIELRPDIIGNYIVWGAPAAIQREIRQLVEKSHKARKEASQLLETAKRQVERMILRG